MANVLSRTKPYTYLVSVNTPEYPEEDWIRNPDMSGVIGVPPKYWVIEGDTVREMTADEKTEYDLENPLPPDLTSLNDGTPAYYNAILGIPVSVNVSQIIYSTKTSGSRNFYLGYHNTASNSVGYPIIKNSVITTVSVAYKRALSVQSLIHFRYVGDPNDEAVIAIPANQKLYILATNILININRELCCYLESSELVIDPTVTCETYWRN